MKERQNTTALKVKFLGYTDTKPSRLAITQLNNNKRVVISLEGSEELTVLGYIFSILEKCDCIKSYYVVVDNTQDKYYLVGLDFQTLGFDDVITEIKDAIK